MLNYLYPNYIKCLICSCEIYDESNYGMCKKCYESIVFTSGFRSCSKCGRPILNDGNYFWCTECQKNARSFSEGYSCVLYEGISERIIMDFKYNDKSYMYKLVSEIMLDKINECNISFDYIVFTPVHFTRKLVRGFNQTELIASYIASKTNKILAKNLIIRRKRTKRLKKLSRKSRESELLGVFEINENIDISGDTILLIDDIFTTGTTLNTCSEALIKNGASEVKIITFAVKCNYDYNIYK